MSATTPGLSPRTAVQLPLTRQLAELYVGNKVVPGLFEPFRAWGLCSRMVDVARVTSGARAREVHGLTAAAEEFPAGDGLFVLRFAAGWPGLFRASFGGRSSAAAARLNSTLVLPEPFLGTGFTAFAEEAVPEYWMDLAELPIGAELWHMAEDGAEGYEQGLARYAGRHSGWRSFPMARDRGLVPGGAAEAPAHGVPRGPFAAYQGTAYPADFGPGFGELTAYRTEADGSVMARRVSDTKCDAVEHRRTLATWRGAEFEVLADDGHIATLALAVANAEVAAELELTPAGRHAWRTQAPTAHLEHVAEEVGEIGVQPQFGAV